jgi:drug/metabolite transporter (DMT)-like permease
LTLLALALILVSALLHATWNLFAKRARGGAEFVWLFAVFTVLLYAPVVAVYVYLARPAMSPRQVTFALVSSVIHVGYFLALQRGYRSGDLSLVYPVARGSGPALATLLAILALGERPGPLALTGTALVVGSVFVLLGGGPGAGQARALGYGLVTGMFIATYTVWDGFAVGHLRASPLLYSFVSELGRVALLTPLALVRRRRVLLAWRTSRREALGIAALSPLAYILVLTAMRFTPVSLVAPAREISILLGAVFGTRLLAEGHGARRLLGAAGMVAGVTLLALS